MNTNRTKVISFAYPMSSDAILFGYAKTGCWICEVHGINGRIPQFIATFPADQKDKAIDHFENNMGSLPVNKMLSHKF